MSTGLGPVRHLHVVVGVAVHGENARIEELEVMAGGGQKLRAVSVVSRRVHEVRQWIYPW